MKQNAKDVKEDIINTAKYYFYNEGYENTTIRQIAKKLEFSHSNILYHFKNKEEILKVIFEEYFENFEGQIYEIKPGSTVAEVVLSVIYVHNYFIRYNKKFSQLYFASTDIIIDILFNQYAKEYYPQMQNNSLNVLLENKYLIDVSVMINAEKEIFKLNEKGYIHVNFIYIRDYIVNLFAKVRDLSEETFASAKDTAELVSRQFDYSKLNIFDEHYRITL